MNITIKGLTKTYHLGETSLRVLDNLDFSIQSGEFVAILGQSGSGKTTLLNILGGLDRNFEGNVFLDTQNIKQLNDRSAARLRNEHIGFVFQQFHLLNHLTALENVVLPYFFYHEEGTPKNSGKHAITKRALDLLKGFGLAEKAHIRPPFLSGGQKQRIAIARALLHKPKVILCDEPTGSLDLETGEQVMNILQELNREGITLIVVTHEQYIARLASRAIRIEDGHVQDDLSGHGITSKSDDCVGNATDGCAENV